MGLKDYKEWKLKKQILEVLGLTEEDLSFLPEALNYIRKIKQGAAELPASNTNLNNNHLSNAAPASDTDKNEPMTPEQYVQMFAHDVEEFYPNGR